MGVWKYNFVLLFEINLHLRSDCPARVREPAGAVWLRAESVQNV